MVGHAHSRRCLTCVGGAKMSTESDSWHLAKVVGQTSCRPSVIGVGTAVVGFAGEESNGAQL